MPDPSTTPSAEIAAWELFERLRWGSGPVVCPHCDMSGRAYFLAPRTGTRRTRTGAVTARRVWKCGACRRQFSVLTGTVLEGTRIPLTTWIAAIEVWVSGQDTSASSLASAPIRRHLGRLLTAVTVSLDGPGNTDGADRTPGASGQRRSDASENQLSGRCQDWPRSSGGT